MQAPPLPSPRYLTVGQVAARLSVSTDTIWRWCRLGTFPKPYRIGGNTSRWRLSEIEEYEASLTTALLFSGSVGDSFLAELQQ